MIRDAPWPLLKPFATVSERVTLATSLHCNPSTPSGQRTTTSRSPLVHGIPPRFSMIHDDACSYTLAVYRQIDLSSVACRANVPSMGCTCAALRPTVCPRTSATHSCTTLPCHTHGTAPSVCTAAPVARCIHAFSMQQPCMHALSSQ